MYKASGIIVKCEAHAENKLENTNSTANMLSSNQNFLGATVEECFNPLQLHSQQKSKLISLQKA
jgi:hypothetical protein